MQQNDSTVVLDSVPYATSGAWAVNLWMKVGSVYGDNFQYLFSHAEDKFYSTGWESNQASLLCCAHGLYTYVHHALLPSRICTAGSHLIVHAWAYFVNTKAEAG